MAFFPKTRYAPTADGDVAYQIIGDGPETILFTPAWSTNIEVMWEEPRIERFFQELSSLGRVIVFDKRGSGISDPIPHSAQSAGPVVELASEDMKAVLDHSKTEIATILAVGIGCWPSILFAATSPSRVQRLIIVDGMPCLYSENEDSVGLSKAEANRFVSFLINAYGTGKLLKLLDPAGYRDRQFLNWYARFERLSIAPKLVNTFWNSAKEINITSALNAVKAPTLVLSRSESRAYPAAWGKTLAEGISGADFRELPGTDSSYFMAHPNPIIEHTRTFMTGVQDEPDVDRILTTILFTDLVASTEKAAALGDREWSERIFRHNAMIRREISRFRGVEVDNAGDGFMITFDGPARALRCADAIRKRIQSLGLEMRIGIHTGECELIGAKIGGIAVHTAARIMSAAQSNQIIVSRTVKELVAGAGLNFEDLGEHELKGVPDRWQLYILLDSDSSSVY